MSEISKKSASSHDEDSVPSTSRTNTIYSEQPPGGVVKKHYDLDKMVNLITSENFPKEVMVSPGKHTPGPISEDVVAMMDISANTVAATSTTSPLSEKNENVSLTKETLTDNKNCETLAKKRKNDLNYHSGKEEEKNKKARLFSESKGSCSVSSSKKKKKKKKKESRDENENTDTKKDKKEKKEKKAKKDKKNSSTGRRQTAFSHVSNHPVIHIVHGSMLEDSL